MIYTALDTFYLSAEQLENSPSRKDGIGRDVETTLRIYGAELIQEAGILLKLPQVVMATGQVLLHRFYCKQSFSRYNVKRVAASCVWLAAKLEETPRKIRDVLFVFHRMNQRREGLPLESLEQFSQAYSDLRTELIRTERHLLKEMGFICHVEHPHKFIPVYLQVLGVDDSAVQQEAWSLANDSLRTPLCVRFKSEVVACGVIYAATRRARVSLPESPAWWLIFDATKKEIDEVCRVLADLYRHPKAGYLEVCNEKSSHVLASRAWEPTPEVKSPPVVHDGSDEEKALASVSHSAQRDSPSVAASKQCSGLEGKPGISVSSPPVKASGKITEAGRSASPEGPSPPKSKSITASAGDTSLQSGQRKRAAESPLEINEPLLGRKKHGLDVQGFLKDEKAVNIKEKGKNTGVDRDGRARTKQHDKGANGEEFKSKDRGDYSKDYRDREDSRYTTGGRLRDGRTGYSRSDRNRESLGARPPRGNSRN